MTGLTASPRLIKGGLIVLAPAAARCGGRSRFSTIPTR